VTRRYRAAILALTVPMIVACASGSESAGDDTFIIGVVYDGSGPSSAYSGEGVRALEFAVEQVNEGSDLIPEALRGEGAGILGQNIEVRIADDGADPNRTVSATRKLIGEGADAIMFSSGSASAIQGRLVCEQEKVLCIAPNNVSPAIVEEPNASYVFTVSPAIPVTADVFVHAFKTEGYKTIAYTSDDGASAQATKDIYQQSFEAAGFTTVADEVIAAGASDVTSQVTKVRDGNADVLFDVSISPQVAGLVYRTTAELMPDTPRWATNVVPTQPETWELAGDSIVGLFSVDMVTQDNPYTSKVAAAYKPDKPFFLADGMAWDSVLLVKRAAEEAGSTDGTKVVEAMEEIAGFEAAHGQPGYTLSFSADNHNGADPRAHVVVQFAGDGFRPADAALQPR
jgi:branched-chain amino acid transport system substrate-binding protein